MTGPMYVTASYRDGHLDVTQVPSRNEAYRVHRERIEKEGAETAQITQGLPSLKFMPRDSVSFRPYDPHRLITDVNLPRPVRKGSRE
jgi:hypothetical protein